jgi:peptidoglycan/LPS O-acetylase OafA/YrhL
MYYNIRPYYGLAMFMILFLMFSNLQKNTHVTQLLNSIGRRSLWIFLIHFPLMGALFPLATKQSVLSGTPFFVVATCMAITVSIVAGYVVDYLYTKSGVVIRKTVRISRA